MHMSPQNIVGSAKYGKTRREEIVAKKALFSIFFSLIFGCTSWSARFRLTSRFDDELINFIFF